MDLLGLANANARLEAAKREAIVKLGNQAQNYFVSSWRKQGWDGKNWKEVQRRTVGTNAYKYPKNKGLQRRTKPILIGAGYRLRGGTLRRAVSSMMSTAQLRTDGLRMVVNVPYAAYHNEGIGKQPKRQFVGQDKTLTEMQERTIKQVIDNLLRN